MLEFAQYKNSTLLLIRSAIDLAQSQDQDSIAGELEEAANHLTEEKIYIVACGEFKQGKSSFINALLNESSLFPVDIDITTNLVSTISYGPHEVIEVLAGETGNIISKAISRDEIATFSTEQKNKDNVRNVRLLTIISPNELLKDGLVFVDTPGIGGLNERHTEVTQTFIPNADAAIFVSDAHAPLTTSELNFISNIAHHCPHIIQVVTKIDSVQDYVKIVESNRAKLADMLGDGKEKIAVVPVSSLAKLDYLESQDEEDLADSNFDIFREQLWRLIGNNRAATLTLHALNRLSLAMARLNEPLQVELSAIEQRSKQKLEALEQQYRDSRSRLQEMLDSNTQWRTMLSDGLQDIRMEVLAEFQDGFVGINRHNNASLDDEALLRNPQQIVGLLELNIDSLMTDLWASLNRRASDLFGQMESVTGLSMGVVGLNKEGILKAEISADEMGTQDSDWFAKSRSVARGGIFNIYAGSVVGGVLGLVVGGALGAVTGGAGFLPGVELGLMAGAALGGVAGIASGAKEGLAQITEKDRKARKIQIVKIIKPYLEDSQRLCQKKLTEATSKLERIMRDELVNQLREEKQRCERTLASISGGGKLSRKASEERSLTIKREIQRITRISTAARESTRTILSKIAAESTHTGRGEEMSRIDNQATHDQKPEIADKGDWADG
ncbi:MAG: dynamin family protein [gamma proteobacterium endosymbiont of Lamellibrachia anaximandri]|nr:dynamin family protein [gamma proteobacterium endosymbiont of Lamellibrachia anaximandri]MBL3616735.1 dynamin family protein [gamma proteobacterium endosymbiont of Lamellibrachia anaximandri]